jgi:serine/threonine protein kinase
MAQIYGGRWQNLGSLGEGGQGHVFRVKDIRAEHQGEFALKRVQNSSRNSRFQNEVEAIKRLQHPNIIRLIDHSAFDGEDGETQYLVMPIAEGGDLAHDRRLRLYTDNIDAVLSVSKQIALGLSTAHAAEVIHRDIKPANILSTGNGHDVWISDFGICFFREAERHTAEAEVVGARFFMAPELEYGGKLDVTPAADIYSLGKVIFFLMSGGVVLPREYLHQEQFAKHLDKSEQHRFLGALLHKMICPVGERMGEMNQVIEQLDYIGGWQKNASLIPINSATLSAIEMLRKKQLQATREAEDDEAAQESKRLARLTVVDTFHSWLQEELNKTVKHVVEIGGLKCSSRHAEIPTHANFQIQFDNQNFYECINGLELVVEAVGKGINFIHILQFYLCEERDLVRSYGYHGVASRSQSGKDPFFAFLPLYRKINPTHPPKSSAEIGYLNRRQFVGTIRGRLNLGEPGRKIDASFDRVRILSYPYAEHRLVEFA